MNDPVLYSSAACRYEEIAATGEAVLVPDGSNDAVIINQMANIIYQFCQEPISIDEIANEIAQVFKQVESETIKSDVEKIVQELVRLNVIQGNHSV